VKYWITNPNLTPEHDWKVDSSALGDWQRSGWQVREDQNDPAPELPEQPEEIAPADPVEDDTETPADDDEPDTTDHDTKGEV
jgi:hypothetical protein